MSENEETPEGFLKHAQEFFDAADLVLDKTNNVSLPAYFLLGRSIELSLKAYLMHQGVQLSKLRSKKYGHNLKSLLEESQKKDLDKYIHLEQVEIGVIGLLSFDYSQKRLEYRVSGGTYYLPLLNVTFDVARKLAYELGSLLN